MVAVELVLYQEEFQRLDQVETAGSLIERLLPKSIHAITAKGFELKVMLFTLAASLTCL